MNAMPDRSQPTVVAILRGLTESDAVGVGSCLYEAGLRTIEVPLNSPGPLGTIATLRRLLPDDCLVGAGTVLTQQQVRWCHDAGAELIVSPDTNPDVIAETLSLGMQSLPGTATPSEALRAANAGATGIKIFPALQVGLTGFTAWTAILPDHLGLIPVGGVDRSNLSAWLAAGATGVGIGSSLYRPGISLEDLSQRAIALMTTAQSATEGTRESE